MNTHINLCIVSRRYCNFSINTIFRNFPSIFSVDVMEINNYLINIIFFSLLDSDWLKSVPINP